MIIINRRIAVTKKNRLGSINFDYILILYWIVRFEWHSLIASIQLELETCWKKEINQFRSRQNILFDRCVNKCEWIFQCDKSHWGRNSRTLWLQPIKKTRKPYYYTLKSLVWPEHWAASKTRYRNIKHQTVASWIIKWISVKAALSSPFCDFMWPVSNVDICYFCCLLTSSGYKI